jgi:lipopolysaccharide transport system permease protein
MGPTLSAIPQVISGVSEHRFDLIRELLLRDVRLRYRRSVLGLFWTQLNPLAQIVIFSVIFTRIVPLKIPNYPVFVFVGVIAWQWFESGLLSATSSVVGGRDLLRRPGFPGRLLPPLAIATGLVEYVLALPILLVVILFTSGGVPGTAIVLPAVMVVQFLICLGPAYLLATLQVFLRDTSQVVAIVLRVMFFATPVIYNTGRLSGPRFRLVFVLNPMAHLIDAQRDALVLGRMPRPGPLVVIGLVGIGLTALGMRVFEWAEASFPEEI